MPSRFPADFFRKGTDADSRRVSDPAPDAPSPRPKAGVLRPRFSGGVAPRVVIAGVLGCLLVGFGIGRLVQPKADIEIHPTDDSSTSMQSSLAPSSPVPTLVPYEGAVRVVPALGVKANCPQNGSRTAAENLLDDNRSTFWRCRGAGVDESLIFEMTPGVPVVGVRIVNGNTVWADRYRVERRILSIRWTFADGSWVIQGLSANEPQPQEVRFPPVKATQPITMTIVTSTIPGGTENDDDAVSISSLEFLTPA